jgi:hypothetical protein
MFAMITLSPLQATWHQQNSAIKVIGNAYKAQRTRSAERGEIGVAAWRQGGDAHRNSCSSSPQNQPPPPAHDIPQWRLSSDTSDRDNIAGDNLDGQDTFRQCGRQHNCNYCFQAGSIQQSEAQVPGTKQKKMAYRLSQSMPSSST